MYDAVVFLQQRCEQLAVFKFVDGVGLGQNARFRDVFEHFVRRHFAVLHIFALQGDAQGNGSDVELLKKRGRQVDGGFRRYGKFHFELLLLFFYDAASSSPKVLIIFWCPALFG